ncbi:hypothetical protein HJFPF1_00636 [Paramyrothecium foliicola]|nr:hypothetical protein HJFPF1_00636 [Paramyrothecium foliicola]
MQFAVGRASMTHEEAVAWAEADEFLARLAETLRNKNNKNTPRKPQGKKRRFGGRWTRNGLPSIPEYHASHTGPTIRGSTCTLPILKSTKVMGRPDWPSTGTEPEQETSVEMPVAQSKTLDPTSIISVARRSDEILMQNPRETALESWESGN